ncbi:uncharacterized protein EpC_15540 [Erwinia pyrifoliae Ep1/96]|nr:uncharacterized protein EpC_15540 [Erwinia pyrifoliae Ep1/96]
MDYDFGCMTAVLRCTVSMLINVTIATDKKNPNKGAGVWYWQTSRQRSACCAAKSVGYLCAGEPV